jgi:predicted acetyltransferase
VAAERFPSIWVALVHERPGVFRRDDAWWKNRIVADPPDRRAGGGPKRFVLLELDGEDAAYAIYRHNMGWSEGSTSARLSVNEAIGTSPQATAEIWRFLLDVDWQATISASLLPVDHPLFFLLAKPRRLKYRLGDGLWVRLVDVGEALSSRSYVADGEVVFEVADAFAPWNEGRWKLAGGRCVRTDEEPGIRCDVSALGAAYLGAFTFAELERGLRVEELRPGAIGAADAMFRWNVAPWCPEIF